MRVPRNVIYRGAVYQLVTALENHENNHEDNHEGEGEGEESKSRTTPAPVTPSGKSRRIPALRKSDGKRVMVSPETLKKKPQEYGPRQGPAAGGSMLHQMVIQGRQHTALQALKHPHAHAPGNDLQWAGHKTDSALDHAARSYNPAIQLAAVKHPQAHVHSSDDATGTPLAHAARHPRSRRVENAIVAHEQAAAGGENDYTPLQHLAQSTKHRSTKLKILKRINREGNTASRGGSVRDSTTLHRLALNAGSSRKVGHGILDHKDADLPDAEGYTPAHHLALTSKSANVLARVLKEHDKKKVDTWGGLDYDQHHQHTAADIVRERAKTDKSLRRRLRKQGADV